MVRMFKYVHTFLGNTWEMMAELNLLALDFSGSKDGQKCLFSPISPTPTGQPMGFLLPGKALASAGELWSPVPYLHCYAWPFWSVRMK